MPLEIHCHYFCLLFSHNLEMRGKECEGIKGFLASDIVKERNRGRALTCFFCKRHGPTSACCEKSCKVAHHLPCAVYRKEELAAKWPPAAAAAAAVAGAESGNKEVSVCLMMPCVS